MTVALLAQARLAFLAAGHTLRNERRDFPEWHRGRARYALWALDVDLPEIRDAVTRADAHLAGWLLDGYRRQPHITLALCGFPTATPQQEDDFGPEAFVRQLGALRTAIDGDFTIGVGALASFSSAPFLTVGDPDSGIARLRRALVEKLDGANDPDFPYLPHVTVGLYADCHPSAKVLNHLDQHLALPIICRISRLSLQCYAAPEIGGPLTTLGDFTFASGRFDWHDQPTGWPMHP